MINLKFDTKEIEKLGNQIEKKLSKFFEAKGESIARDARANCDDSLIKNSIQIEKESGEWDVSAGSGLPLPEMAAYIEFGTGNFAAIQVAGMPEDWRKMAWRFYVNGMGRLPASPYMYPAFQKNTLKIEQELKELI